MSVVLDTAPLAPSPDRAVRPPAFAKKVVRWMLRDAELRGRYEDPNWVPYTAWRVLEAVAELIALDPEVREYRLHPHDAVLGLATRVARQVGQSTMAAEVERALALLARAGLIVLMEGGMRLGRDYEPDCPHPALKVTGASEAKATAARTNGKAGGRPPGQRDILLPLKGGLSAQPPNDVRKPTAEPKVGSDGFAAETQTEPQSEPTVGSGGFSAAPRAPGLLAAAAQESVKDSKQQQAATSLKPRAPETHLELTVEPNGFSEETQIEPTEGHRGCAKEPTAEAKPKPTAEARTVPAEAFAVAQQARKQFGLKGDHWVAAPGIAQGYLDDGYTAIQLRTVLDAKRGTDATSLKVLGKALADAYPEVLHSHQAAGRTPPVSEVSAAALRHPDLDGLPGVAGFDAIERTTANRLLTVAASPDRQERYRAAKRAYDVNRRVFEIVARRHPEFWPLIGEEPPDME